MLIVDSQVHVWELPRADRPWPPGGLERAHRPTALMPDDLLKEMDEAGVDRAVLVPPSWEGDYNDLSLDAARRYPDRFGVMARVSLRDSNAAELAELGKTPGMLGLRLTFHTPAQHAWLSDGTADWVWPAAEKAGIPLMVHVPGQVPAIDKIAERHPALRLTVDHLSLERSWKDQRAYEVLPDLLALAKRPNVAVKASALPGYSTDVYPYRNLHGLVRQVIDAYGPERVFWGTDMSRMPISYRQIVTMFTEEMGLSEREKDLVMGRAICDWLGWKY
jgi:predicted TIM-barrel fold metal-dependent hydrolase